MEARIDYSKGARTKYNLISQRLTRTIVGNSDCHYLGVGEDYWFGAKTTDAGCLFVWVVGWILLPSDSPQVLVHI